MVSTPHPRGERTRQRLLDLIRRVPGLNRSELARRLAMSWNSVAHHLRVLEERGLIHVAKGHWEHVIFPTGTPRGLWHFLRALHDEDAVEIVAEIATSSPASITELSERTGRSRKVVRHRLERLLASGFVKRAGENRHEYVLDRPPIDLRLPFDAMDSAARGTASR